MSASRGDRCQVTGDRNVACLVRACGIGKRGQVGEGIMMIYRLLIVTIIAFVIFGVSSVFYDYEIDIRDAEARLLGREIFDCLAPAGVLNLDEIPKKEYGSIVSYCGISSSERIYVGVDVMDFSGKTIASLYEGDSGAKWIAKLYGRAIFTGKSIVEGQGLDGEGIGKYNPGYINPEYSVFVLSDGVSREGKVEMEVIVNYEN